MYILFIDPLLYIKNFYVCFHFNIYHYREIVAIPSYKLPFHVGVQSIIAIVPSLALCTMDVGRILALKFRDVSHHFDLD